MEWFWLITIGVALSLAGCNSSVKITPVATVSPAAIVTLTLPVLPTPYAYTTHIPDAEAAALAFLEDWKATLSTANGTYAEMYAHLDHTSQQAVSIDQLSKAYQNVADEAALSGMDFQIVSNSIEGNEAAQVKYHVVLHSIMVGDLARDMTMPLVLENGEWLIHWDKTLIMPELIEGRSLRMEVDAPERAAIYDVNGKPIANLADATSVGLNADNVKPDMPEGLLSLLSQTSGLPPQVIQGLVDNAYPGVYLPMGEVLTGVNKYTLTALAQYGAVVLGDYKARFYDRGGIAPQVVGYVSAIQKEELSTYRRQGYRIDESVGRKGLEGWGEKLLTGKHGGILYLVDAKGTPVEQLGAADSQPGQEITTTLESDFQLGVQNAIRGFRGAVVVLERDTGRVLAMASAPGFDPNAYQTANLNWVASLNDIGSNPDLPQFNRASMGQYPLGSVFKVITMAAALNSGYYTADTTYECGYEFTELPGFTRYDWTWDHFQQDGYTKPSGHLTLPQGLIRSCDPFFWHIGLDLYNKGLTKAISDMARAFGLGSPTGIQGVEEEAGKVPDPNSQVDALNLAIGQGDLQVTPLQVADFMAAVGNGGILYRPQVIEWIGAKDAPSATFKPEVRGNLPIKPDMLKLIQDAMRGVTTSKTPRGTAYDTFAGFTIPVAAKTGTATVGAGLLPHGWFAGYTLAENKDRPDIAIAVVVENIGEGADWAAPIFRRVVELYFNGRPQRLYRWEAAINVTKTPTPIVTETETPTP